MNKEKRSKQDNSGGIIILVIIFLAVSGVWWWFTSFKSHHKNNQGNKRGETKEPKKINTENDSDKLNLKNEDCKTYLKNSSPTYQNVYGPNKNKPESKIRWVELVFLKRKRDSIVPYPIKYARVGDPNVKTEEDRPQEPCGIAGTKISPRKKKQAFRFRAVMGCNVEEYEWGFDQKWIVRRISDHKKDENVYGKVFRLPEKKEVDLGEVHYIPIVINEEDFISPEEGKRKKQEKKNERKETVTLQVKNIPFWIKGERWDWNKQANIEYYFNRKEWESSEPQKYEKKNDSLFVPIEWKLTGKIKGTTIEPDGSLTVRVFDRRSAEMYTLFYLKDVSDNVVDVNGPANFRWEKEKVVSKDVNLYDLGINTSWDQEDVDELFFAVSDSHAPVHQDGKVRLYRKLFLKGTGYPEEIKQAVKKRYLNIDLSNVEIKSPPGTFELWVNGKRGRELIKKNFHWPPE